MGCLALPGIVKADSLGVGFFHAERQPCAGRPKRGEGDERGGGELVQPCMCNSSRLRLSYSRLLTVAPAWAQLVPSTVSVVNV